MIPSDVLYILGVVIYLLLKDGIPVAVKSYRKTKSLYKKRQKRVEDRIRGLIQDELQLPPKNS